MGLEAIYPKPRTSIPHPGHRSYPYRLRGMEIDLPNQVCVADITYVPMARGFMYRWEIRECACRKVLAHRVSNSPTASLCGCRLVPA